VPAFVRLPGGLRAGASVGPVHVVDVYPTLVAIAGGDARQPRPVDGVDLSASLLEAAPLPARDLLLGVGARRAALRSGDWKLVLERTGGLERAELFDLAQDPEERHDRAGQEHERVEELRERLARFAAQAPPVRSPGKKPPPGFHPPEVWGPTTRP
jgi:arylsulfatase A-like enzyme